MPSGIFLTLEGPEGSGKSTQVTGLIRRLREHGLSVVKTREPGGTPTGEMLRDILQHNRAGEPVAPETEVLLFAASRAQHMRQVILPALERGEWVVCDRFVDSTYAYQGFGRGFDLAALRRINEFAICGRMPDLTLLLDMDIPTARARLQKRQAIKGYASDRIEAEAETFHQRVRDGYLELAHAEPRRFRILNAGAPPHQVAQEIWATIEPFLPCDPGA